MTDLDSASAKFFSAKAVRVYFELLPFTNIGDQAIDQIHSSIDESMISKSAR